MELPDAYRVLEVANGADEERVRDARKTLSKVWHPDRYTSDPALQAKAEIKLREINEAYEAVRAAGFPTTVAARPPAPARPPEPAPIPPPKPVVAPAETKPTIEFVPRRRVRWPVIVALCAAVGIGAYFAILELGSHEPALAVVRDAALIAPLTPPATLDAALVVADTAPPPISVVAVGPSYTFGATQAQVISLQGEPNGTDSSSSSDSITVNGQNVATSVSRTKLTWGHSEVDLVDDKVVGWWDNDVRLRVRITPRDPATVTAARLRGTLAKGQTSDDVLGVLGMPTRATSRRWSYGSSEIELDENGRIVATTSGDVELHLGP